MRKMGNPRRLDRRQLVTRADKIAEDSSSHSARIINRSWRVVALIIKASPLAASARTKTAT